MHSLNWIPSPSEVLLILSFHILHTSTWDTNTTFHTLSKRFMSPPPMLKQLLNPIVIITHLTPTNTKTEVHNYSAIVQCGSRWSCILTATFTESHTALLHNYLFCFVLISSTSPQLSSLILSDYLLLEFSQRHSPYKIRKPSLVPSLIINYPNRNA